MEPGLIGYWRFNEAKGSVAYDKSEFENNGVVSLNAYFVESEAAIGFIPPPKPVGFRAIGTDNLVTLLWKANDSSDTDHYVLKQYGVWVLKKMYGKEYYGVERSTFIINPEGNIAAGWRIVKVQGHIQEVMEKLKNLQDG